MSTKFVNSNNLETLARGLYDRVDTRLDGKSFKYLTLAEYEALTDAEKNDDNIVYQITDKQLSYNDLVDKPEIPSIEGLASEEYVMDALGGKQLRYVTSEEYEALSQAEKDREDIVYQITDGELSYNDLVDTPDLSVYATIDYVSNEIDTVEAKIPGITILTQAEYDAIEGTDQEDPDTFYLISDGIDEDTAYAKQEDLDALSSTVNDLKSSVSNGKSLIAAAITDMGVATNATDSWAVIAENIRKIQGSIIVLPDIPEEPDQPDNPSGGEGNDDEITGDFQIEDQVVMVGATEQTITFVTAAPSPAAEYNTCGLYLVSDDSLFTSHGMFQSGLTSAIVYYDSGRLVEGEYEVYLAKEDGEPRSNNFTLSVVPEGVASLTPSTASIEAGDTQTFTVSGTAYNISSVEINNDCASVISGVGTQKVTVTALKSGVCVLTVTLSDNTTTLSSNITVTGSADPTLVGVSYPATKQSTTGEWNALGDSITYGYGLTKAYPEYVGESISTLTPINNYGVTSSCISSGVTANAASFMERYNSMSRTANLVTVFGGVNDFLMSVPIGTTSDTTANTFYGAVKILITALKNNHPNARIVFFTPIRIGGFGTNTGQAWNVPNNAGHDMKAYRNAIVTVCNAYNVEVLDLYSLDELDCTTDAGSLNYQTDIGDLTHPNETGQQIIAQYIIDNMLNQLNL